MAPLILLLWNRLSRILLRVAAATRAIEHPSRSAPRRRENPVTAPPRDKLPRQFGWLIRRVPDCAVYGEHLRILLDDPQVQFLLAASPRLRKLLRPLWRMLRQEPPPDSLRTTVQRRRAPPPRFWPKTPSRPVKRPATEPPLQLSPALA